MSAHDEAVEAILQRPVTIGEQARAIASLIAEREAAARREALEAAARWHETQIKRGEEAIWADPHVNYAAAIRSLAAKEATNGC